MRFGTKPTPTRGLARLEREWAPDARYADVVMSGTGHKGVAEMIWAARAQFPGHAFTLRGLPDGHGEHVRFSWTLASDDDMPIASGTDIVRLDAPGRIAEVVGFLDGNAA